MHHETRYKFCKFRENRLRDTPLWGAYIRKFSKIFVNLSVLGALYPYLSNDGGEIWHAGVDQTFTPPCQISPPSVQRVAPAGRKTSKLPSD